MFNIIPKRVSLLLMPIIVSMFVTGCGIEGDPILGEETRGTSLTPSVVAVTPVNNDSNVSYNTKYVTAEFSVPMDPATLDAASFTLSHSSNPAVLVTGGAVTYANRVAELALDANLSINTPYTATISTKASSKEGVALSSSYVWTFTTGSTADETAPEVNSTSPRDGALKISVRKLMTATFSEAMSASSITAAETFRVMETNTSLYIKGNVTYSVLNKIASFNPTLDLNRDTNYTAIITTAATDLAGNPMLNDYNWTFKTADAAPELVALGLAATYGIAATAGVTNTGATQIDGSVVLNPTAECNGDTVDNLGGFGDCGGSAPTFPLASGHEVITPDYPDTTTAQNVTDDLRAAYLSITPANMPGGTSIAAPTSMGAPTGSALVEGDNYFKTGVYTSNTSILVTGDLTLDAEGDPNATFVFQSASTVGSMSGARILLMGGAKASNVYWQAGSSATLQTNTVWNGNIFAYASITMVTGASSCGRLFAGAFTDGLFVFDSNKVAVPGNTAVLPLCK